MWTQIRLLLEEQSDLGPHCLPVCKNRFEKSARIFSRRHKQTTLSDAVFLGALRVNDTLSNNIVSFEQLGPDDSVSEHRRPCSDCPDEQATPGLCYWLMAKALFATLSLIDEERAPFQ